MAREREGESCINKSFFARLFVSAAVIVLLSAALAEAGLQILSLFASHRYLNPPVGTSRLIVCLGDSHTFGAGLPVEDSYPFQLQTLLNERSPGTYSVINLGVPGMNTAQALNRLPGYVDRFEPEIVIVWAGINNSWNWAEVDDWTGSWTSFLRSLLARSRLYRLIRVRLHDWRIEQMIERRRKEGEATDALFTTRKLAVKGSNTPDGYEEGLNGRLDPLTYYRREIKVDGAMERRTYRDFRAMAEYADAAGIRLVFVTYPTPVGGYAAVNRAARRVAQDHGLALVDSSQSLNRLPKAKRKFIWAHHPTGPIYLEIARDLVPIIESHKKQRTGKRSG
jgi:hypothetical protein